MDNKRTNSWSENKAATPGKKLRQTTLPWAPKPRSSVENRPPPPALAEAPRRDPSPEEPSQNASSQDSDASSGKEASYFRQQRRKPARARGGSTRGQRRGRLERVRGGASRENSFNSETGTEESFSADTPLQHVFEVPEWSRPLKKVNMGQSYNKSQLLLQHVAHFTLTRTPEIVALAGASSTSTLYVERRTAIPSRHTLRPEFSPGLPKTAIKVVDMDTLDCAVQMLKEDPNHPVGVLNMANAFHQGGGWLEGKTAQEEQICYRTTLIQTLKLAYYPLPDVYPLPGYEKSDEAAGLPATDEVGIVFSPSVAIFREGPPDYGEYDLGKRKPEVISIFTCAAWDLRRAIKHDEIPTEYKNPKFREIMMDKIRLILRVAGRRKVRRLVLGALGCGVFRHPPTEVANIFLEVFHEPEFANGWWMEIQFAVYAAKGADNFIIFRDILDGQLV